MYLHAVLEHFSFYMTCGLALVANISLRSDICSHEQMKYLFVIMPVQCSGKRLV